jgi:hypothetical protein
MREIVGAGRLVVAAMRPVPPVWPVVRGYAPAQITDDEAIESLGVGLDRYGHLANLHAPGEVAQVIAAFADRLPP